MKDRKTLGLEPKKGLTPQRRDVQVEKASCRMIIKFHDGNTWSKWSNEHAQPNRITNISAGVNEFFRVFNHYFTGKVASAAIFDTRISKTCGAHNKIYQFERGNWTITQAFTW